MDILFLIGIFLLPFENFFFAPTSGWAAIAPIIFFLYLMLNVNMVLKSIIKYRKIFIMFFWVFLITLINLLFIDLYVTQAVSRMISALISLGMGIVSLLSFDIYLLQKKRNIKKIEKIILYAYSISFCIGFLQYFTIKFNIKFMNDLFVILSKRNYLVMDRVQYCFTEPSFIGMHLFGVLLPLYICGKNKKILNLIIVYVSGSILFNCGMRIIFDTIVVLVIFLMYEIDLKKIKNIFLVLLSISILIIGFNYVYSNNVRFQQIVNKGVYADGSFASRWFRINASVKGYVKNPLHTLIGYGFGQEVFPLKDGYYRAKNEYVNSYFNEVIFLESAEKRNDESVTFCLFVRIISEWGALLAIVLLVYLIKFYRSMKSKEWRALLICVAYLYIQFESYAFYSLWLMLVLIQWKRKNCHMLPIRYKSLPENIV